jgi:putative intracellular protease/amidase
VPAIPDEHPRAEQLQAFGLGLLPETERPAVERHIAGCAACCELLRGVPDDTLASLLRDADTSRHQAWVVDMAANVKVPPELADHPRYRIVKLLGAGGMGVVYQAEHRLMDRLVALKVISPALVSNPNAVQRFRQEVKAAARLSHPHIVAAYDADQAGDLHFLVMEYVDGISLARLVEQQGPLAVGQACHYVRQTALGLQHAAEQGMVHRDIKPQNLMLTRTGQIKILDFGLARLARAVPPADSASPGLRPAAGSLTSSGVVLGTPDYIAPEQARDAHRADIRADIYSLGCTLYFLLSGRVPFPESTALGKVVSHLECVPSSLADLCGSVPAELNLIVARMMAKDPAQRYQTPAEVVQALAPFAQPSALPPRKPPDAAASQPTVITPARVAPRFRPAYAWLLLGALAVSCLGLLALVPLAAWLVQLVLRDDAPPPTTHAPPQIVAATTSVKPVAVVPAKKPCVLIVMSHRNFWYPDYGPVREILEHAQIKVEVASSALTPALPSDRKKDDPPVQPDRLLDDARVADYDAVVFVGIAAGSPCEFVRPGAKAKVAKKFCEDMAAAGKYVTALCRGVAVLADAGMLKGQRATYSPQWFKEAPLLEKQADWRPDEKVVPSGKIITCRDWFAATEFAEKLVEVLQPQR